MNATDMTKGKPMKLLFLFSLPLMFGNVFQQLYTVVDTMIVGQTLGVSALAALGAAESLGWMSLGSIQGLTQGFSIRMAQQFGAKDEDGLHQAVGHSIVLSALLAVLLTIVFQAAVRPVLAILQTPEDIKPDTILYLRILFAGIPIVVAYNLLASMLRAIGDSKTPLIACSQQYCIRFAFCMCVWMGHCRGSRSDTYCSVYFSSILFFHNKKAYALTSAQERFALGS